MPSAFRRAGPKHPPGSALGGVSESSSTAVSLLGYRGVKPWTGGIHLTSVGLNDLDVILGGGQPLGTCILLREDRWTRDLALSLVKYWTAEAISQGQKLLIPVARDTTGRSIDGNEGGDFFTSTKDQDATYVNREVVEDILLALPRNLHWDKQRQRTPQKTGDEEVPGSWTIQEEDGHEDDDEAEEGLKVAWQYKKSVQQQRSGLANSKTTASTVPMTGNVFCHSYDLSKSMADQQPCDLEAHIVEMHVHNSKEVSLHAQGLSMFRSLVAQLESAKGEGKAIRLLLFHTDTDITTIALPLLMVYIRKNVLPVVVMVCSPPMVNLKFWASLSRSADVVMVTEGFASRKEYPPPPEFRHLQGLLTLSNVSTVTAATANGGGHFADLTVSKRPAAYMYGFKRDRRKLHITLLHIPPEDYAEGGGSVGSGVRSGGGKKAAEKVSTSRPTGGGMGCASNMTGSPLDF